MLDANEQAKGGFGAFAARERERLDGVVPVSADLGGPVADGTAPVVAHASPAPAAPTGRQPKRWR